MLAITTWLWGDVYGPEDVLKLRRGVARNFEQKHSFVVITDRPGFPDQFVGEGIQVLGIMGPDLPLTRIRGCFARLRLFDPLFQENIEIVSGAKIDRIVNMDLDTVITGSLDQLFNRAETFMILQGANAANPCPFNGSLMLLRAGAHPEVWSDFSLDKAKQVPFYEFPDDQGWLWHKLPYASGWKVGSPSGIYAFQKPGWPKGNDLPADARMVVFPGWRSPEKFKQLSWIKENWT